MDVSASIVVCTHYYELTCILPFNYFDRQEGDKEKTAFA